MNLRGRIERMERILGEGPPRSEKGRSAVKQRVELGNVVRDRITGLQGMAVARTEWLHGCVRITIQPPGLTADGAPRQSETVDEAQLDPLGLAEATRIMSASLPGGPRSEPIQHADPV